MSPGALIARWTAPARRAEAAYDALIALPLIVSATAVAWRLGGGGVALVAALATLAAAVVVAWLRVKRFDLTWLVARLDARRPELEDSAELLFASAPLGPLQSLQRDRLMARLDAGSPEALAPERDRRWVIAAWIAGTLIAVAAVAWPRPGDLPQTLAPVTGQAAAPGAPRLVAQGLRIRPPAYTGLPVRDQGELDARVPEGTRLEWTFRFSPEATAPRIEVLGGASPTLRHEGDVWQAEIVARQSMLYRVQAGPDAAVGPLRRIDVTPDAPPQVRVLSPENSLTFVIAGQRSWTPVFSATDDYGVAANARLRITLAIGEGENVTFSEREISITARGAARDRRFAPVLDFGQLGFAAGGDLVVQLVVRDTRSPGPQEVRGPSLILRWPTADPQSSGLEGMINTTLPAYFRSQRQIIIDAEALIRQQRRLSDADFLRRSENLGGDQAILRGRYSQFLGGETEGAPQLPTSDAAAPAHTDDDGHDHGAPPPATAGGGFGRMEDVLAEYGHEHGEAEASGLDPNTRRLLRQAVDAMWLSERELKTGHPDRALPHANEALDRIKEVQQATRIFLNRVGRELPPIDPTRRMTGKREGIDSRDLPLGAVEATDGPAVEAWRILEQSRPGSGEAAALSALETWVRANGERLPDPLAITAALDAVRRDPGCSACRQRLRGVLWTAMERPEAEVLRRRTPDATGARYLDRLAGGGR
ncbi:hypothetical protein ASG17_04605 [Brevundimonas sp. Leaf363]|uniref:DUF4175 family protein n=1 Tax=Brevundimonas sp. Leaf363 TaxID=1736353 RepID=UPI000700B137|nr:DUF4175 family protein [Brevundimonas sp. Leaf363]KQS55373.1 hypothetical protein ASG17_04605 [Brevundimonas sp. Leaf363]